jgi:HPt (histidine-containing phosphotransfer) domain-containing protein
MPAPDDLADPVDPEALTRLDGVGRPGLVAQLITLFLETAPDTMEALHTAHARRDLDGVARAAHRLRSSASNFGAARLVDLTRQIERRAETDGATQFDTLIADAGAEFARVRQRLEEIKAARS